MRVYIVKTDKGFVATQANNKVAAWEKVKAVYPTAEETTVFLSSHSFAYCGCTRLE